MDIHWYPGHMAKAKRLISEQLKLIDVVVELCDARLPLGSRNPDIDTLCAHKRRVLVLNKSDLARESATKEWIRYFDSLGLSAIAFSAKSGNGGILKDAVKKAASDLTERMKAKGASKTVRFMICGIPNVGKSTVINRLYGSQAAKVGDRPGVTRGKQWIKLEPYLEVLDTPGLLWPKLEDKDAARRLAFLGTIRDDIMDTEQLAGLMLAELMERDADAVIQRYKMDIEAIKKNTEAISDASDEINAQDAYPQILLEAACRGRGFILSGGRVDVSRGAAVALDEFRAGRLGRQTLEVVPSARGDDNK